ncbi:hypothetical protein GH714_039937 [Hevea brasiliensis]|uniref:Wall-associated receptor kinase galacturonan-binding domain-containing protein n=1 Tax=Hevea brasiliensis TaxID=3981 RepID=A0A6A6MNV7_HEVBR|nr:hypothetical protein GH714_039937 [Hevea brasiliensis]
MPETIQIQTVHHLHPSEIYGKFHCKWNINIEIANWFAPINAEALESSCELGYHVKAKSFSWRGLLQRTICSQDPYEPSYISEDVMFVSCESPVESADYVDTAPCVNGNHYRYALVGIMAASALEDLCTIDLMSRTSPRGQFSIRNLSYADVHKGLAVGFELSWFPIRCEECRAKATALLIILPMLSGAMILARYHALSLLINGSLLVGKTRFSFAL